MEAFSLHVNLTAARPSAAASSLFNQHRTLFSIFSTTFLLLRSFLTVASHTQTLQFHTQTPTITQQRSTFSFLFSSSSEITTATINFFNKRAKRYTALFLQRTMETPFLLIMVPTMARGGQKFSFFRCVLVFLTWAMDFSFCNHSTQHSLLSHSPGRHGHSRESADALLRE